MYIMKNSSYWNKIVLVVAVISVIWLLYMIFIKYISVVTKSNQSKLHHAKAMVLTCMDFRLIDDIVVKLNNLGYMNNYDQFILAGASLGYNGIVEYKNWNNIFDTHIDLAMKLHNIKQIILIDHLDCGGYKLAYNKQELENDGEYNKHVENLKKAKETLNNKYPGLLVKMFIIDIEGNVMQPISS
jgi:carbonic anhydrase